MVISWGFYGDFLGIYGDIWGFYGDFMGFYENESDLTVMNGV